MTGNQPSWARAGGLSPERPIELPEDDLLERAGFAARLAQMLVNPDTRAASGVVVGVTGSWGASHLGTLLDRLAAACRDRLAAGELFSLADPTPLRVLRWMGPPRWDGSFEAATSRLLEENEGLDRLVSLFHGTEPPREVVQRVGLADIVPDVDRAFRRLQDRGRNPAFASQPEMLQKAYERAWDQLNGRLRFNRSLSRDRDNPEASANP